MFATCLPVAALTASQIQSARMDAQKTCRATAQPSLTLSNLYRRPSVLGHRVCLPALFAAGLALAPLAQSQNVRLAWDASPSTNVARYIFRYGEASRGYDQALVVGKTTIATVSNLTGGIKYFFVVTSL